MNASSSQGMWYIDRQGKRCVDLAAGLVSCLGYQHPAIVNAIAQASQSPLASPSQSEDRPLSERLGEPFGTFASSHLFASANEANEFALRVVRSQFGGNRYRVISLLGSDHGDTFLLRSLGGRIEQQGSDGPVAAGFRHVMPGDIDALTKAIDDCTAAVCLSPVNWNRGGEAFDGEYLAGVEAVCREKNLLLVVDETKIPPGVGGQWFFHERAGLSPDLVTLSAGWFGGLLGGLALVGDHVRLSDKSLSGSPGLLHNQSLGRCCHMQELLAAATAKVLRDDKSLQSLDETADAWAAMIDELAGGFDFVRECVHAGLWTTIEVDLPAAEVAHQAQREGLRMCVTGDSHLLCCPPVNVTDDDLLEAIDPLRRILESIERETTSS